MEGIGETGKTSPKPAENAVAWIAVVLIVVLAGFMSMNYFGIGPDFAFGHNFGNSNAYDTSRFCNDGTLFGKCSKTKPYYCNNEGILSEKPSVCGCPATFNLTDQGNDVSCVSNYQQGSKKIKLNYIIDGKNGTIALLAYKGFANYTSKIPRSIEYFGNQSQTPSRVDFKLKSVNDNVQRDALSGLVKEIQNITPDRDEQAKIAVSIVQNIPYGFANGTVSLNKKESVDYTRYPYEVIYDNQGICGEKSQLLAFLLRDLGYGTAIFYNPSENHESIGIKCPLSESWHNSGYCFVETSGPAIISDSEIEYSGGIRITSDPQILKISDGISLSRSLGDYSDAKDMESLRQKISESGQLNYLDAAKIESLRSKYGLDGEYRLV